jgi:hypothetical protein
VALLLLVWLVDECFKKNIFSSCIAQHLRTSVFYARLKMPMLEEFYQASWIQYPTYWIFFVRKLLNYFCQELIVAFIRLADLIINVDCIAAVKFSTYSGLCEGKDIPLVSICLVIPEGSLDGTTEDCLEKCKAVEKLEYESDLAIAIWNYFIHSDEVTVIFE